MEVLQNVQKATPETGKIFGGSEDGHRNDCHEQAWPLECGERLKQINFVVCKIYINKAEKVIKERRKERKRGREEMMENLAALKLPFLCLAQPTRANPSQLAGGRLRQLKANRLPELRWGHPK